MRCVVAPTVMRTVGPMPPPWPTSCSAPATAPGPVPWPARRDGACGSRSSRSRAWRRSAPATTSPAAIAARAELEAGDVVVVTQKVVSKAEGRLVEVDGDEHAARQRIVEESRSAILRRRDELVISETSHGFVCANAGVDFSNVDAGWAALLPEDPDRSARRIRDGLRAATRRRGRRHRLGHLRPALAAGRDGRGHRLCRDRRSRRPRAARSTPTAGSCRRPRSASPTRSPSAAELVMGKAVGVPVAVVRGVDPAWLRAGVGGRGDRPAPGRRPVPLTAAHGRPGATVARSRRPGRDRRRRRPSSRDRPRPPAEVDARPGPVEGRALELAGPGRGVDGRHGHAGGSRHGTGQLVDRHLVPGADVEHQPAARWRPGRRRRRRRRRRRSRGSAPPSPKMVTGSPARSRSAKMATTPASPWGSWRGP